MKLIVFGTEKLASLAWYVLTHDSPHEVVAFTVDRPWCHAEQLHGLPLLPFDELAQRYPPDEFGMIVPLGWTGCNKLRATKQAEAKALGYQLATYVSSRALVWPDLDIGENSMVYEGANIQPFAKVGAGCILRSGCNVSHHAQVGDHAFLAVHSVVAGSAVIGERCFLGINSTVRDGVTVAPGCFIAAGALVTADTEPDGLYVGVPAKRRGMADSM